MIGAISYANSYNPYAYSRLSAGQAGQAERLAASQRVGGVATARRADSLETPVQPAPPVSSVKGDELGPGDLGFSICQGADPVEMAVRMRIQYPEDQPLPGQEGLEGLEDRKSTRLNSSH